MFWGCETVKKVMRMEGREGTVSVWPREGGSPCQTGKVLAMARRRKGQSEGRWQKQLRPPVLSWVCGCPFATSAPPQEAFSVRLLQGAVYSTAPDSRATAVLSSLTRSPSLLSLRPVQRQRVAHVLDTSRERILLRRRSWVAVPPTPPQSASTLFFHARFSQY